jgi:hypothetical protein
MISENFEGYVLVSGDGVKLNISRDAIGQSSMLKGEMFFFF